jgi:geranylgeranyl diphosphate synthase, type I
MDVASLLKQYAGEIEVLLKKEIPEAEYAFISEGVWYQFSSGGKRIRPALCLLACEALGGDPRRALHFALAAEILHNVLLIHDDIEDGDTVRRDQQTLWARFGIPNAINVSDFLISRAYKIILRSPLEPKILLRLIEVYSETYERTVEGQALDINLRGAQDFTIEQYYRIVQLKTAYYLTFNLVGGALAAGVDGPVIDSLWELGRWLGPAFQIRDDIIDLTEGKGRGGEVGCDIREGKPSIFFAFALQRGAGSEEERRRLVEIVRRPREQTSPADVKWAIDLYRRIGALDFAQGEARRLIEGASGVIDRIPMEESHRESFRVISRFMIDRST